MRKLLIKLVAVETILVGWLSYWLFLVYADNPAVAAELGASLQRFPQLSFSTIDIAVMVIIAALAVTLAFKFQRGLRPGIRLERALQMLENLMKRNLVLEAQVAELKIEKSHSPPSLLTSVPVSAPSSAVESKQGSWEKAFRTPLEAGPAINSRALTPANSDVPFGHETGIPPPRIEAKTQPLPPIQKTPIIITDTGSSEKISPPMTLNERALERPGLEASQKPSASSWEDSPQFIGESKGILTPSIPTRRAPTVADSGGLRQPYIPVPAPKVTPASVIVGPMTAQNAPRLPPPSTPPKITAKPTPRATTLKTTATADVAATPTTETTHQETDPAPTPPSTIPNLDRPTANDNSQMGSEILPTKPTEQIGKTDEKTSSKSAQPTRKKSGSDGN